MKKKEGDGMVIYAQPFVRSHAERCFSDLVRLELLTIMIIMNRSEYRRDETRRDEINMLVRTNNKNAREREKNTHVSTSSRNGSMALMSAAARFSGVRRSLSSTWTK